MGVDFTHKGKKYSSVQLQKGILGMESTYGTNTTPRYESKFHNKLKANKEWVPTTAERRVIKERGYDQATKDFSTSYGPYQILPETAYRRSKPFAGNPEDLEDPATSTAVWLDIMKWMHKKSGGDLEKAIGMWNENPEYLDKMIPWMGK